MEEAKFKIGDEVALDGEIYTVEKIKPYGSSHAYLVGRGDGNNLWATEDTLEPWPLVSDSMSLIERLMEIERHEEMERQRPKTDKVNSPDYYNRYSVEVVEMARRIWGDEAMKTAAEITAFIYRMRMGTKPDNPIEQDFEKEEWWLRYKNKLK